MTGLNSEKRGDCLRVLAVSDNHGNRSILTELIAVYKDDVDAFIHCGDSELSPADEVWNTMAVVRGNMDFTNEYPLTEVIRVGAELFFVTHGHRHQVKLNFDLMANEAKEVGARVAFYGHTHVPAVDQQEGIFLINPGSISQPRGSLPYKTYAVIDIKEGQLAVRYYTEDHDEIPELFYQNSFCE